MASIRSCYVVWHQPDGEVQQITARPPILQLNVKVHKRALRQGMSDMTNDARKGGKNEASDLNASLIDFYSV